MDRPRILGDSTPSDARDDALAAVRSLHAGEGGLLARSSLYDLIADDVEWYVLGSPDGIHGRDRVRRWRHSTNTWTTSVSSRSSSLRMGRVQYGAEWRRVRSATQPRHVCGHVAQMAYASSDQSDVMSPDSTARTIQMSSPESLKGRFMLTAIRSSSRGVTETA